MALEAGGFTPHRDYRGFVPAQQFYDALVAKGFTPNAARGILGNAMHESGGGSRGVYLDPPTDAGHYNWGTGDAAVGAIQWEGKRQAGVAPTLQSQVDKIWDEFNNPNSINGVPQGFLQRLQSAQSPEEAAHLVNINYERPKIPSASDAQRQRFASVALNAAAAPTSGTTLTSVPDGIVDPSAQAHGSTVNPPLPTTDGYTPATSVATAPTPPPQNVGDVFKRLITRPPDTTDPNTGKPVEGKSPLQKVAESFAKPQTGQAPEIPAMPQTPMPQDPTMQLAGPAQQLFSQVSAQAARPLSWSSTPYGSNSAGQLRPQMGMMGTTLNATGYPYSAGYGYGYG